MVDTVIGLEVGHFTSAALGTDPVRLLRLEGTERLGQLYEFRVTINHDSGQLTEKELEQMLLAPCCLTFTNGDPIHGIAREVSLRAAYGLAAIYEVVIVPTVWLMTVSKMCRVFQGMNVKDMAATVLKDYGLADHSDLRITDVTTRDHVMQYHESDWDYLQRWFEHEGYFYWFEHSTSGEKLCVTDANSNTTPIGGNSTVPYRDLRGVLKGQDGVLEWGMVQRRIPARIVLKDYDEDKPLLSLVGKADVDTKRGFGTYFEYGDEFDTPAAGAALAKKRAERFQTERLTLTGVTNSTRFHVGHWFQLSEHFDDEQCRKYLITAIDYQAGGGPDAPHKGELRATFEAIPFDVQYRPERRTAWPSIAGVVHAHIDSDSSGKFSTLDSKSRYRIRFPFDTAGKKGEKSSTWVRLAQGYAGSGYGSHSPLHLGTEVIVAFYDGDPDRPVIVGAVPNAITSAASTSANASQSTIRSASGIHIAMDDEL